MACRRCGASRHLGLHTVCPPFISNLDLFFDDSRLYLNRLTESHTGVYLADKVAELLRRYGLEGLVSYVYHLLPTFN